MKLLLKQLKGMRKLKYSVLAHTSTRLSDHKRDGSYLQLLMKKCLLQKRHIFVIFICSKDSSDDLGNPWAIEQKHFVSLIWGELNLQTSLDAISKISKYLMGTDSRRRPLNTYFLFCKSLFFKCKAKHRRSHGNIFQGLTQQFLEYGFKNSLMEE